MTKTVDVNVIVVVVVIVIIVIIESSVEVVASWCCQSNS